MKRLVGVLPPCLLWNSNAWGLDVVKEGKDSGRGPRILLGATSAASPASPRPTA